MVTLKLIIVVSFDREFTTVEPSKHLCRLYNNNNSSINNSSRKIRNPKRTFCLAKNAVKNLSNWNNWIFIDWPTGRFRLWRICPTSGNVTNARWLLQRSRVEIRWVLYQSPLNDFLLGNYSWSFEDKIGSTFILVKDFFLGFYLGVILPVETHRPGNTGLIRVFKISSEILSPPPP